MISTARIKRILADMPNHTMAIVFMVAGVLAGLGILRYSLDLRQQAALSTGTAVLSLNPGNGDLPASKATTIDIMFNSQADVVDGLQVEAIVSGAVPEDITYTPAQLPGLNTIIQTFDKVDPSQPNRKLVVALLTSDPTKPYTTNSAPVKVGTISFTSPASGKMDITFNPQNTITTRSGSGSDILKIPVNGSYNFVQEQQAQVVRLLLGSPSLANPQQVGRAFTVDVTLDAANAQVSGVDAKIKYDQEVFTVTKVEKITGTPFTSFPQLTFDQTSGLVSISANVGPGTNPAPVTGNGLKIGRIFLTPKNASSNSSLSFLFTEGDRNDSNVIDTVASGEESNDILTSVVNWSTSVSGGVGGPSPTPTPSASPTPSATPKVSPTPTPSASPSTSPNPNPGDITARFGFQGKRRANANKSTSLQINYRMVGSPLAMALAMNTTSNGETKVPFSPGNYEILVKAPGYLARKFGSPTSPINVTTGTTLLDFSTFPLLGGDFNQDGTVNEVDYSLHFLTKFRTNDPMVDLDGSGEVNNLDFAIMRSNWGLNAHVL